MAVAKAIVLACLVMASGAGSAHACRILRPFDPNYVTHADTVIVGRISRYEIVLDQSARQQRRQLLANSPNMPPALRDSLARQTTFLSDYARFEVTVDKAIKGKTTRRLTATWNNSTYGEPRMLPQGPYLIAFRNSSSPGANVRDWSVLQEPCAPAFILEIGSQEAVLVNRIVK